MNKSRWYCRAPLCFEWINEAAAAASIINSSTLQHSNKQKTRHRKLHILLKINKPTRKKEKKETKREKENGHLHQWIYGCNSRRRARSNIAPSFFHLATLRTRAPGSNRKGHVTKKPKKKHEQLIQKKLIKKSVTSVANFAKFNRVINASVATSN